MRYTVLVAACTLLSACVMVAPQPVPQPTPYPGIRPVPQPIPREPRMPRDGERDTCGAARLQYLVGGFVPQPFPARGTVRIYRSDMSVTMEYDPRRINVETDPVSGRIVSVTCG